MPNAQHAATFKPLEAANYAGLAAALGAAFAGYKLFEPKFDRIGAMKAEVRKLSLGFRVLYVWPQYLLILASAAIFVDLLAAFIETVEPGVLIAACTKMPGGLCSTAGLQQVLAPKSTIFVLASIPVIGAIVYWNVIPRLLLCFTWLLATMPISGLRNRFGKNGESLGWHQTAAVIERFDKGQPLLIDGDGVERVASEVFARMSRNAGVADFAEEPQGLSAPVKANIALFGCIIEQIHYDLRWPLPQWGEFYAALADVQDTEPLFAPAELLAFSDGAAFFQAFRVRLEKALKRRHQPCPPDTALAAAEDVATTWEKLTTQANGDMLRLSPRFAPWLGGRIAWLDLRLRKFPRLADATMRPQLLKVLNRWGTLPVSLGVFTQPFSRGQGWLLLQHGALRAMQPIKEVSFNETDQIPITRLAALRVVRRVAQKIAEGRSPEAKRLSAELPDAWSRIERADFAFWSWAREAAKEGAAANWVKPPWYWRLDSGRVTRL